MPIHNTSFVVWSMTVGCQMTMTLSNANLVLLAVSCRRGPPAVADARQPPEWTRVADRQLGNVFTGERRNVRFNEPGGVFGSRGDLSRSMCPSEVVIAGGIRVGQVGAVVISTQNLPARMRIAGQILGDPKNASNHAAPVVTPAQYPSRAQNGCLTRRAQTERRPDVRPVMRASQCGCVLPRTPQTRLPPRRSTPLCAQHPGF